MVRGRLGLCRMSSRDLPTTLVDLSSPPFSSGDLALLSGLISIGKECVGKRRVVLVGGEAEYSKLLSGWSVLSDKTILEVCAASLSQDLEVSSGEANIHKQGQRKGENSSV